MGRRDGAPASARGGSAGLVAPTRADRRASGETPAGRRHRPSRSQPFLARAARAMRRRRRFGGAGGGCPRAATLRSRRDRYRRLRRGPPHGASGLRARLPRKAVEIGVDVPALHERFVDTVVSGPAFARTCRALCDRPWPALLEPTAADTTVVVGDGMPDAPEQAALAARLGARVVEAASGACGYARAIMAALDAR